MKVQLKLLNLTKSLPPKIETIAEPDEATKIEEFREEENTAEITESDKETVTKHQKIETVAELDEVTKIEEFREEESTTKITESHTDEVTKIEEFTKEESTTKIIQSITESVSKDQKIETVTDLDEVTKIKEEESIILDRKTAPLVFTKLLENKEAVFGETVEFTCEMSQTGVEVTWFRNNQPLCLSESRYLIVNKDYSYKLVIANVMEEDFGEYSVRFGKLHSTAALNIKG